MDRLVAGQEVDGSNLFAPTIVSPLNSIRYAAFSTVTSGPDLGTTGTTEGLFVETGTRAKRQHRGGRASGRQNGAVPDLADAGRMRFQTVTEGRAKDRSQLAAEDQWTVV